MSVYAMIAAAMGLLAVGTGWVSWQGLTGHPRYEGTTFGLWATYQCYAAILATLYFAGKAAGMQ